MRLALTYIALTIIALLAFIASMLIAAGLNPLDIIRGVWGAQ